MRHLGILLVLVCWSHSGVEGIDFGLSKVADSFASGASEAAKASASAISSVIPGASRENGTSSTTPSSSSVGSSDPSTVNIPTSSGSSMGTSSSSTLKPERVEETQTEEELESTTPSESTSNGSSWVPEVIKKPFEAVVSIPGQVADTISETVVNQDPVHSVKFYLYDDPKNLTKYKHIVPGQPDTLRDVRVAPGSKITLLIHGFMQDYNSSFPQDMKDTLLTHIGGPVVCVDWGHMADGKWGPEALRTLLYPFIVDNVAPVGEYVGEFIVFLRNNSVISNYDQVHVIGFSLGGHVSGIAGHTVQNRTDGDKVGRITGLDPAGPKFFLKTKERKLNEADAKFVDVIHTSHLGYFLSLGHIDFFPNGGKIQPGCVETDEGIPEAVASLGSLLTGSCSHARAHEYYIKSIKDNDIYGCECNNIFKYELTGCEVECEDKVPFGEPAPSSARGAYFLSI